jgi:hypothetical protein
MTNGDSVFPYQNVFHHEPYDSLAFTNTKRFRRTAQASKECREGLGQTQEGRPIVRLVSDCLQLSAECLFTLAQRRHALAQLLD